MAIRLATPEDSEGILRVYGQYIDTTITFEYELPSVAEFTERIRKTLAQYPYLVWEEDGLIVGYAYASRHRERAAYQWDADLSIYIDRDFVSHGIGKRLYTTLIALLQEQGVKNVYGGVTSPNEKSEALHLGLGFRLLGVFHNVGYKCGQWLDVNWYEKQIAPYPEKPEAVIPFCRLRGNHADLEA